MSLSRPGETEPIHSVSYGHVAACQLMGPHTLALRVGESQILLQSPQVSGKEGCGKRKEGKKSGDGVSQDRKLTNCPLV